MLSVAGRLAARVILIFIMSKSINGIKIGDTFDRKLQCCSSEILAKMLEGGCSGDQQNVGRALKQPRERNLHWRGLQ